VYGLRPSWELHDNQDPAQGKVAIIECDYCRNNELQATITINLQESFNEQAKKWNLQNP